MHLRYLVWNKRDSSVESVFVILRSAHEKAICRNPHNSSTGIPALLDSWVTITLPVKILCKKNLLFVKKHAEFLFFLSLVILGIGALLQIAVLRVYMLMIVMFIYCRYICCCQYTNNRLSRHKLFYRPFL